MSERRRTNEEQGWVQVGNDFYDYDYMDPTLFREAEVERQRQQKRSKRRGRMSRFDGFVADVKDTVGDINAQIITPAGS